MKYDVIKQVNLPVLKKEDEVPLFIRFEEAMYIGKTIKSRGEVKGEKAKGIRSAATLAQVTNMETGEICLIVINQLLKENLNDTYPGNGYVHKVFRVVQHSKEGKNYKTYSIAEIVVRAEQAVLTTSTGGVGVIPLGDIDKEKVVSKGRRK